MHISKIIFKFAFGNTDYKIETIAKTIYNRIETSCMSTATRCDVTLESFFLIGIFCKSRLCAEKNLSSTFNLIDFFFHLINNWSRKENHMATNK